MSKTALHLTINGEAYEVLVEPHHTLLDVLRHQLGLTGTKANCLEAECGVCTVLFDDMAVNACILLALRCQGHCITTIEGLAGAEGLHALQETFITHGAVQCGYCIPGMIMAAKAYLDENPTPTREDIRAALVGNLCRCTGYQKIIDAVAAAAAALTPEGQSDGS